MKRSSLCAGACVDALLSRGKKLTRAQVQAVQAGIPPQSFCCTDSARSVALTVRAGHCRRRRGNAAVGGADGGARKVGRVEQVRVVVP